MSPEEMFLAHRLRIERQVRQRCAKVHFRREETEDALSVIQLKLIEDDYAVFRKFKGESKLATYLVVVISNLLHDYLNHLWGKWRPSAAAEKLGRTAIDLERLIEREGLSPSEAIETLLTKHVDESRPELEAIVEKLTILPRRRLESDDQLATVPAPGASPEEQLADKQAGAHRYRVLDVLRWALAQLDPKDKVIIELQLRGMQLAAIARTLHLPEKPLYRGVEKIHKRLRRLMESRGVRGDDLKGCFPDG